MSNHRVSHSTFLLNYGSFAGCMKTFRQFVYENVWANIIIYYEYDLGKHYIIHVLGKHSISSFMKPFFKHICR